MTEYFGSGSKKGRGRAKTSLDLIEAMHDAAEAAHPITGRGIGYKLFTKGLIPSMGIIKRKNPKTGKTEKHVPMRNVYRLLLAAREEGLIPWHWIVDETRDLERAPSWNDPADFAYRVGRQYRAYARHPKLNGRTCPRKLNGRT